MSQQTNVDSLKGQFAKSNNRLEQAEIALQLAGYYTNYDPDTASNYVTFALEVGRESRDRCLEGKALVKQALVDTRTKDSGKARLSLETAYEYLTNCPNELDLLQNTATKLGFVYMNQGMYLVAQNYFYRALDASIRTADLGSQAEVESYLSVFYRELDQHDEAQRFSVRAVKHARQLKSPNHLAYTLRVSGEVLYASEHYHEAQLQFEEALRWSRTAQNLTNEISSLHNLARNFVKIGRPDSALAICNAVYDLIAAKKMFGQMPSLNWTLANVYQGLKDPDAVIRYSSAVLEGEYQTSNPKNRIEVLLLRATTYAQLKDYQNAYDDLHAINQIQDSLTSSGTMLHVLKKRETQLISQMEQEHAAQISEKEIEKRKLLTALIALGIIAVLLLASVWFYRVINRSLNTKRKTIERQKEALERLNMVKNRLFALISHDLRGPVSTAFQGAGSLQQQYPGNLKTLELKRQLQKTNLLLDNLLVWAKAQLSGITIFPENLQPGAVAAECISLFEENSSAKNLQIDNRIPVNCEIISDPYILKTALRNILYNAIQHSPEGGRITLTFSETSDQAYLGISDEGPGFDPERMKSLLSGLPLEDTGASQQTLGKSGLGLSVCILLLRQINGHIEAKNLAPVGSRFSIVLEKEM